jgi:DNA-binding IclR family transcriptional regulator
VDGRVLAVLVAEPRPWTAEEIAARTDVPLRTVKRALGKLVHDRHLRKAGGGKFTLSRRR